MNNNLVEPLPSEDLEATAFVDGPVGPSSKGCCKVSNGNACGSGSLVGKRGNKSIVLTNAHVAGTRIGHTVICTFPFANNEQVRGTVIMAGYSDRVMMDWAVLELDKEMVDLPHAKLSIETPSGSHYSAGYPRCRGPYFSELTTRGFTYKGTVWKWQPNAIGGQSGSGVHSKETNLQRGLLTWSWGGDGAGQTTRSIWFQYSNQAVVGFPRPDGLIELAEPENRAEHLEEGFFSQTNITTLPIWAHLDEEPEPEPPTGGGDCKELADRALVRVSAIKEMVADINDELTDLIDVIKGYKPENDDSPNPEDPPEGGPLFGLGPK